MNNIAQERHGWVKKYTESVGHQIKSCRAYWHEIKESTELAEHETGVDIEKMLNLYMIKWKKRYRNSNWWENQSCLNQ